jgi:putative phosphonate metabolism protein
MKRYAIYYAPDPGPLADFTAAWLGWDPATGRRVAHPVIEGLPRPVAELTEAPRRYGFHGTLMAPFRLADPKGEVALYQACSALAMATLPLDLPGLRLSRMGGFLALTPQGDTPGLVDLAATILRRLNPLRARLTPDEIARRRPETLTMRQRAMLEQWGYPYVLDDFQFHMTLTGPLSDADLAATEAALAPHLVPLLPRRFEMRDFCLFGEAEDGMFRMVQSYSFIE